MDISNVDNGYFEFRLEKMLVRVSCDTGNIYKFTTHFFQAHQEMTQIDKKLIFDEFPEKPNKAKPVTFTREKRTKKNMICSNKKAKTEYAPLPVIKTSKKSRVVFVENNHKMDHYLDKQKSNLEKIDQVKNQVKEPEIIEILSNDENSCFQDDLIGYQFGVRTTRSQKKKMETFLNRRGFMNLGNTCYMNSILHSLYASHNFSSELKKLLSQSSNDLISCLNKLFDPSNEEVKKTELKTIKLLLEKKNTEFSGFRQQDAHEFLMILIDILNECTKPLLTKEISCPTENFRGTCTTTFSCTVCQKTSTRADHFYDMGINIVPNSSVQNLLMDSFRESQLEKQCSQCASTTVHTIGVKLEQLPKILVLCLKRFSVEFENGNFGLHKINDQVEISKTLDLSRLSQLKGQTPVKFAVNQDFKQFVEAQKIPPVSSKSEAPGDEKSHYTLRSFITHLGSSCKTGHYISYVNDEWKWIKCDDEMLTYLPKDLKTKELESNVYILFYELNSME